ncbi:alpha/beta hydrolase family protein [Jidongwangia harbinensis]|uniref:alpha/beta hydrolase family protein n=1 Tax=Jidongwangia harbinensis TaxID=2878561 RepID=UPI001CD94B53|nr:lipase [Jidongwangia harbinensis]MCA2212859.1 lipase [Jidongwangia harbinensis]
MRIPLLRVAIAAAVLLTAVAAPVAANGERTSARGRLLTAEPLRTLRTAADVSRALTAAGFDATATRYGVDTYRLTYSTVDPAGRAAVASGLLAVPRTTTRELPTVSYAHGTEIHRADAPSTSPDGWSPAPALTFGSAGFVTVAPDYLGLGLGSGTHPYLHVPSETTAGVDLLRAARAYLPATGHRMTGDVWVTGFSQGATAAIGLARALRSGADRDLRLRALAPIAGAYDLAGVELPALRDGVVPPPWNVGYLAYLMVAWDRLHNLSDGPLFTADYAGRAEALFDSLHTGADLAGTLPDRIDELFSPAARALLDRPAGRFAAALRAHDGTCAGELPDVPVRLIFSAGDEQVPAANTEHCAAALHAPAVDVGDLAHDGSTHLGSNVRGVAWAARWFGSLARA